MLRFMLAFVLLFGATLADTAPVSMTAGDITISVDGSVVMCYHTDKGVFLAGVLASAGSFADARVDLDQANQRLTVADDKGAAIVIEINAAADTVTIGNMGAPAGIQISAFRWGDKALPCRLDPGTQGHLVHLQQGIAQHTTCDSFFDPQTDTALTLRPSSTPPVILTAVITSHYMRDKRGIKYYEPLDKTVFKTAPSGWCSWYYYYRGLNQDEAIKNLDWMAENLKPFGAEYFQIDDIWQAHGDSDYEYWRDWTGVYKEYFPSGMKWLTDEIRERGMKPGVWLTSLGQSNTEIVKSNPKAWLKDSSGDFVNAGWVGKYLVDPSSKVGLDYTEDLFKYLTYDLGFDYFKIDGQPPSIDILRQNQKSLEDPAVPAEEAYRNHLRAIRKAIGPERFLLGCWGTPVEGIGLMNGSRTGGDVEASWRGFQPAIDATMNWVYTNNIAWYADPDTVLVRSPLTLDQARAWASLYGLTGQMLLASDKMYELPEERVEVLKRVFPPADITPMSLYPQQGRPRVWHLAADKSSLHRDVVGLFNWDNKAQPVDLKFAELDIALAEPASVAVYDFWNQSYVGCFTGGLRMMQKPTSCNVYSLCALNAGPQLLSTSRHITQGISELEQLDFLPEESALAGVSEVVAKDPYTLVFLLDTTTEWTWEVVSAQGAGTPEISMQWPVAKVTFHPTASGELSWRVIFKAVERPKIAKLGFTKNIKGSSDRWNRTSLTWDAMKDALGYFVMRDGKLLGMVTEPEFVESGLIASTRYVYTISAWDALGRRGPQAPPVTVKTLEGPQPPPVPEVLINDLKPISVRQGWGETRFDRSNENNPIRIGSREFATGIGTHAYSEIVYDITTRGFKRFVSWVGVDKEISQPAGTVTFEVWVDGVKKFDTDTITATDEAMGVNVDITGGKELKLIVTDAGDSMNYDHADWADAGFIY